MQQVFVAAQTVTAERAMITQVAPGSTVVFRAYAVDGKTRKVIAAKDVKYFYVKIPNQPNVKLTLQRAGARRERTDAVDRAPGPFPRRTGRDWSTSRS